jgi:hypothetical protein
VDREGGRWREDSTIAQELATLDPELAHNVAEGARLALLGFVSALDHFAAMGVLLRRGEIVLPVATVCRGAIEAAALTYYLLDPAQPARERARRLLNERLVTLVETRNVANRVGQPEAAQQRTRRIAELLRAAEHSGESITRPKQAWRSPHVGAAPPSIPERVQALLATGDLGRNLYHFLSATAHAASHGLAQYLEEVEEPLADDKIVTARIAIPPQSVALRYMAAPLGIASAGERLFTAFGWDTGSTLIPTQLCLAAWARVAGIPERTFDQSIHSQQVPGAFRRQPAPINDTNPLLS